MKQSTYSLPDGSSDEEINLVELWRMFCAGWRLILGGLAFGLVVAAIYLAMTPSQYEATLVVKVGQVVVAGEALQIEAPGDAIERMQEPGFKNAVVESLGWKGDERERLFKHTYQVTSPANKHLKIRLYGFSPEDAKRATEASLTALADIHRGLADAIVAKRDPRRDREFANIAADIADSEAFLQRIEARGKEISPAIWLQAVKEERSRLRALRMQESAMKDSMKLDRTLPTMAAEAVVVSSQAVYPKARRVWLLAVIGGLLLGVLLSLLHSLSRMSKENRAPVNQRQIHSQ